MNVCVSVCVHAYTYGCICNVCIYLYVATYMYVSMCNVYACVYTYCTHVLMYLHICTAM